MRSRESDVKVEAQQAGHVRIVPNNGDGLRSELCSAFNSGKI